MEDVKSEIQIRQFRTEDAEDCRRIWNQVVQEGRAFPQIEELRDGEVLSFFQNQYTAVVVLNDRIAGLYILHPNNVGRVGHIANASYAVDETLRGQHIGEQLVRDSLVQAKNLQYRILQFNAVVASNVHAYHLYLRLGFTDLGIIPGGFHNIQGEYEDIHVMYYDLVRS